MATTNRSSRIVFILLFSLFCLCQSLFHGGKQFKRELTFDLNPDLKVPPSGGDLLHVKAVGNNDTLHFLFCSLGAPTLLLVHTNSSSSTVQVNWPLFLARNTSRSLTVKPESSVQYSTAVTFSRLLEYDDVNNSADPNLELFSPYELKNFTWSRLNLSAPAALLCGADASFTNGSLCFKLSFFGSEGRDQSWPHLLHSANSSQLEVSLVGLLPRATRSRFILELQAVGGAYPLNRVEVYRSIDDEFTPSIFKVSQWVSVQNGSSDILGFAQWKPVAYRKLNPTLDDATACRHSDPQPQNSEELAKSSSLVRGFYSGLEPFGVNVSFGLAGDPFYNSTNFLSWTLLVGTGSPPVDSFSPLVIAIMAVGLGSPLILLLLGGLWVCIRKRVVDSTTNYEPIN